MAFDGLCVAALTNELNDKLTQGRITKIAQPESDELLLTVKTFDGNFRLLISANSSLPLIHLTDTNKPSPLTAPNFCMLLRKHIGSGFIEKIEQPSMERIIDFTIRHLDDLGDIQYKHLIVELMGKHSNIIFTDNEGKIIDSIKHITSVMSSVRQVLPGKQYFIPNTNDKKDPKTTTQEEFFDNVFDKPIALAKAIYTTYTGISPVIAEEICYRANIDSSRGANTFEKGDQNLVWINFYEIINQVANSSFTPVIYEKDDIPKEFAPVKLKSYSDLTEVSYDSISKLVDEFYSKRDLANRMRQKSADLRKIVNNAIERANKKYNIQLKQLESADKKDKFKVYGDILTAYCSQVEQGAKSFKTINFYNGEEITIPLDPTLSPIENAKKFFNKYAKLKRTGDALSEMIVETKASIDYLDTISVAISIATSEDDLTSIKTELAQTGYIKKQNKGKKKKLASKPLHYISSDGYDIYVGKNNIQNEYITFDLATGNDWWFHSKNVPGSHVIVKSRNEELPDRVFEEAAALAAYYSKAANQNKVEIDYIQKKQVKKVPNSMPGFVIYHTNYSMIATPSTNNLELVD